MIDRAAWIAVLVLVVGASALLVGSAGSAVAQTDEPTPAQENETVTVEPHPGPNGQYATVTDTNEVELRFDRIPPTFTSTYRAVFTITVPESGAVWIEHDVQGVTFFVDESRTELGPDESAALRAGETVSVGVRIDGGAIQPGTDSFTVVATQTSSENREFASPETVALGAPLAAGLFGLLSAARRKI